MAPAMAVCYRHPTRETGVACSSCGRPICPDCMTPTPVGMRCPECARDRTQVRTVRSMRAGPSVTMALIAINVVVFVAEILTGGQGLNGVSGVVVNDGYLYGPSIVHRTRVLAADHKRVPPRGLSPHPLQHVLPMDHGATARARNRACELCHRVLRLIAGRIVRRASVPARCADARRLGCFVRHPRRADRRRQRPGDLDLEQRPWSNPAHQHSVLTSRAEHLHRRPPGRFRRWRARRLADRPHLSASPPSGSGATPAAQSSRCSPSSAQSL